MLTMLYISMDIFIITISFIMDNVKCYCVGCAVFDGVSVSYDTMLSHATKMLKDGYKLQHNPWLQRVFKKQETEKATPLTPLGKLIYDPSDHRRQPVQPGTDLSLITFMAIILKFRSKYCMTEDDVNELLLLFHRIASPNSNIPKNVTEIFHNAGPRAPKSLNPYNQVIVEQMLELGQGIPVFNAATHKPELTKVGILFMVCDVPGLAKEQNRVQQNARASCGHCALEGQHSRILDKTIYPDSRKFLATTDPLRLDTSFPSGRAETETVHFRTSQQEMALSRYQDLLQKEMNETGKKNSTLMSSIAQQTGRYGSNHWFRLQLDLQQQHAPVEPMHALKVFAEHITKLLNGDEDGPKVRAAERSVGRFVEACPDQVYRVYDKEKKSFGQRRATTTDTDQDDNLQKKYPKSSLPPAPFTLSSSEKTLADQRLKAIRTPIAFGVIPDTLFTRICGGVKSHTWLQLFTHGILRFCLRDMLGDRQRQSLFHVLLLLEELFKPTVDMDKLPDLEIKWHQALAAMERDYPASLQTYVFHLMHHLPKYIRLYGPPSGFWMFPYERYNHTLTEAVTNNRYPELSAIKKIETGFYPIQHVDVSRNMVQWLLSMLESAGFLYPLGSTATLQQNNKYIYSGRHKPVLRPPTREEFEGILDTLGTTCQQVTVYHHARVGDWTYRDTSIEKTTQREKASMVYVNGFIGTISHFFSVEVNSVIHEMCFINWLGSSKQCEDSLCSYVVPAANTPNPVVPVPILSPPLIHAEDSNMLWIVSALS